jgi:peptidoglycan hydrolase CwlO-like protein
MDLLSGFLIKPESYDLSTRSFKACMPHDSSKRHQFSVEELDYFHPAESSITKQTQELKSKDDGIQKLEKLIEEKSKKIATLQSEITSLEVSIDKR